MKQPKRTKLERLARTIAFWHGQKIVLVDREEGALTEAARHGFGRWGDSPARYADSFWRNYVPAAEAVLAEYKPKAYRRPKSRSV
jgi:hypothetical protein